MHQLHLPLADAEYIVKVIIARQGKTRQGKATEMKLFYLCFQSDFLIIYTAYSSRYHELLTAAFPRGLRRYVITERRDRFMFTRLSTYQLGYVLMVSWF
jgi:hypothetical protein